jgi:hypothetical protein
MAAQSMFDRNVQPIEIGYIFAAVSRLDIADSTTDYYARLQLVEE